MINSADQYHAMFELIYLIEQLGIAASKQTGPIFSSLDENYADFYETCEDCGAVGLLNCECQDDYEEDEYDR
jgi:hypothetical protein